MIHVVLDTNVVVSGIYWPRSTARRVLAGLAYRYYKLALTPGIFAEYEETITELQPRFPACNSRGAIAWLRSRALWFEPAPLGKRRSRDERDDPFLACAIASKASFLVTSDRDLLELKKPFGVETVTPVQFLRWLQNNIGRRHPDF